MWGKSGAEALTCTIGCPAEHLGLSIRSGRVLLVMLIPIEGQAAELSRVGAWRVGLLALLISVAQALGRHGIHCSRGGHSQESKIDDGVCQMVTVRDDGGRGGSDGLEWNVGNAQPKGGGSRIRAVRRSLVSSRLFIFSFARFLLFSALLPREEILFGCLFSSRARDKRKWTRTEKAFFSQGSLDSAVCEDQVIEWMILSLNPWYGRQWHGVRLSAKVLLAHT